MDILNRITEEFKLREDHVKNIVDLLDEGNTIPFIARYRKEATGELSDEVLRNLYERLMYLRSIEEKKKDVIRLIDEQGLLTPQLEEAVNSAKTITELDDIYRPYRPKRRTRATIAKEKGLEPLAMLISEQKSSFDPFLAAKDYINEEKQVSDEEDALAGAMDIIAETISDNADYRKRIRMMTYKSGVLYVKAAKEEDSVYRMYYDYSEPVASVANHRLLAINRGEKEDFLSVKLECDEEEILSYLKRELIINKSAPSAKYISAAAEDSYKRLIAPSVENETRNLLTDRAQESAIKIFSKNLTGLLLQPPIKGKTVLGLDPGYRTGCKAAVVDETGKVLDTNVIYCTLPHHDVKKAKEIIKSMIEKNNVDLISIGNGTATVETQRVVAELIKELDKKVYYMVVSEAGASVYSASKLATEEFPEYDVALRSAVSIARRLQDPLAELVKIDPKAIGVGQYQHDMNQKRLGEALGGVVEDCVNNVGVDLNTASPSLLSYVSGVNSAIAKNITLYREENGKFQNRKQLLKVPKLGAKAFEQCAGFLKITDGDNVFDNTSVHPESYKAATALLERLGYELTDVTNGNISDIKERLSKQNIKKLSEELGIGIPTIKDICDGILKKGRDPREELPQPVLLTDVLDIKDLKPGMIMTGTVRNVIDFGAFVDIGVHQDGLVHISQICNRYIKHPTDVLQVGDIVKVKILDVDAAKNKISLTMKELDNK